IMTSNVGGRWLHEYDGMDEEEIQRAVRQRLREEGFRPEFINRIDEVIVFHQITRDQMKHIVDIQVNRLRPRLEERHITLHLSDEAKEFLANEGYDPQFGARPLKRVIQKEVENRIARSLLDGTIHDGDTVGIDVKDGKLVMETVR
ncbi:MAG: AAA family ATPase, partial [Chloroflexota bacterium]|nr:AAA family ATPase [Chloroflexota bacterium]